ncbi:MAG TPA: alpha-galactosidase [Acidobacteriaceae bacterium]|nr:alpha-galactosidase [Acidobacteriaceae bacterium]
MKIPVALQRLVPCPRTAAVLFFLFLSPGGYRAFASAGQPLAPTPPMGWNSWDAYGTAVREAQVKSVADVMSRELKQYGWQYVVVDIEWYEAQSQGHDYKAGAHLTMDRYGRLRPATNRFPSAADDAGFRPLADYMHAHGLKFGIHILRGIPRQAVEQNTPILGTKLHAADIADKQHLCAWNPDMYGVDMSKPGAQEYYDSIAALYASWGVDFIKADDMSRPYEQRQPEVEALHRAIVKTGRAMVLSLSPGPAPVAMAASLRHNAQMWRISDDFWDNWKLLRRQFDYEQAWAPYIGREHTWPDADMLPLGQIGAPGESNNGRRNSRFTHDEQRSLITLWTIARSPLIFGGDLAGSALDRDPWTKSLLTNPEVLEVDQHSRNNHPAYAQGDIRVWMADAARHNAKYVAAFNIGEKAATVNLRWADLGLAGWKSAQVRDLWQRKPWGAANQLSVTIPAHGCVYYELTASAE